MEPLVVLMVLLISLLLSPLVEALARLKGLEIVPTAFLVASSSTSLFLSAWLLAPELLGASGSAWPKVLAFGPPGLATCLVVDRASAFLALTALLLTTSASLHALGEELARPGFCVAFSALSLGLVGVLFSGDLLTLYVFWEVMCLSAYALVAMGEVVEEALEAAWKYFIMASAGAVLMLFGMSLLYGLAGTLNIPLLAARLKGSSSPWLIIAFSFLLVGMGVEAAIVPLHTWLPDAHSVAPTQVSALLSGMVIEVGFYGACRLVLTALRGLEGLWSLAFAVACLANMAIGALSALTQVDAKRLLAFSSVANVGYMASSLAAPGQGTISALLFVVLNHALSKGLAFLGAGSLASAAGSRELKAIASARGRKPVAFSALLLALASLIGLPGTSGFLAKLLLVSALFSSGSWWLGLAVLVGALLMAAAYIRAVHEMLKAGRAPRSSGEPDTGHEGKLEVASMLLMSALIIALGLWPSPALRLASLGASDLLDLERYVRSVGGGVGA